MADAVKRDLVKEWTCEECTTGISDIVSILAGAIPDVIDFLKVYKFFFI
jgi:hypothetical protein